MTAWWSAAARALESKRSDRLFNDPPTAILLGQQYEAFLSQPRLTSDVSRAFDLYAVVTRFFDDFLLRITTDYAALQVILVASGLDTRPFRLTSPPDTELFELEKPHLLTYGEL